MEKHVMLSIKGLQQGIEGEGSEVELITEGRLFKRGDTYYIEYEETILSGLEGTKTLIVVEDQRISLERTGSHESHFVFEEGRKYINYYETPIGEFEMGIFSTQVDSFMDEFEGKFDLKYQLDIAGRFTSSNHLSISYKISNQEA